MPARAALVVLGCLVCQLGAGFFYATRALAPDMIDELGWTRAMWSSAMAPMLLVSSLAQAVVGTACLRFGVRAVILASLTCLLGCFAVLSGIVGTIIGLVMMLQNLTDPTAIGPAMAVALLTQLYGFGALFFSLVAAFSCARRASTAALGGLTTVSTAVVAVLALGALPMVLLPFFVMLQAVL